MLLMSFADFLWPSCLLQFLFIFSFTVNSLLKSNISILIGPMETSAVVATHPLCSRAGVPQIAPLTSLERIPVGNNGSNYLVRMSPTEKLKAKVLADLVKKYNWETMAVVGYQDDQGKVCNLLLMKGFDCYESTGQLNPLTVSGAYTHTEWSCSVYHL